MRGLESLAVAASESLQHQCAAAIYRTFASAYRRFPAELKARADAVLERTIAALNKADELKGDVTLYKEIKGTLPL